MYHGGMTDDTDDSMTDDIVTGHAAAAAVVGLKPSTFQSYVARGYAPAPDLPPHISSGRARPRWRRSTLERWSASRPGRGWRRGLRGDGREPG